MLHPVPGLTLPQLTSWLPLNPRAQLWSLILSETIPGHSCPASRCLLTPSDCLPVSAPDLCPVRTGSSALLAPASPEARMVPGPVQVPGHICWLKRKEEGGKKSRKREKKAGRGKGGVECGGRVEQEEERQRERAGGRGGREEEGSA